MLAIYPSNLATKYSLPKYGVNIMFAITWHKRAFFDTFTLKVCYDRIWKEQFYARGSNQNVIVSTEDSKSNID